MNTTIQHPLTRTFLDSVLEQVDPDKAYGYWGDNASSTVYDDDNNPQWRVDVAIRPDEDSNVMDEEDWYGELVPVTYRHNAYGDPRPSHFDGRARKVSFHRANDTYWWQPPADVPDKADDERLTVAQLLRNLTDIVENGYNVVIVSLKRRCDCCDQWKEVGYETLSSVALIGTYAENLAHLREVVSDLLHQATCDIGGAAVRHHPDDKFHVILDALAVMQSEIDKGLEPWHDYDPGGDDDPKLNEVGYRSVLQVATEWATDKLSRGDTE